MVIGAQVAKKAATAGPEAGAQIGGQAEAAADGANQNTHNTGAGTDSQVPPHQTPPPNAPDGLKPPDSDSRPPSRKE